MKSLPFFPSSVFLALFSISSGSAAVIYTETFDNNSAGSATLSHADVGWTAFNGAAAANVSTASSASGAGATFVVTAGLGISSPGIGAKVSSGIGFIYTNEFGSIDRSVNEIESISFYSNNNNTASTARMAVQIGGAWYVTTTTFSRNSTTTGSSTNFPTNGELEIYNFDTAASSWQTLNLTPGTSMSLGAVLASPLPSGNITGAGIFFDSAGSSNTIRYDNFSIAVVPEPSAAVLAFLGASGLLVRRGR